MTEEKKRCGWCDPESDLYVQYHDSEWGVPLTEDNSLFQMLVLEGMQAGLSWLTVLKKRESFREAFDNFDPALVAFYDDQKIAELLDNPSIIRNRLKVESAVKNARVVLQLQREYGSFADYLWRFVDYRPIRNSIACPADLPAKTALSIAISKDLKKRGMNFVGPTIIYALMQAVGLVNDHETTCFRYNECGSPAEGFIKVGA
jgi:DNA-3-methyladenine glycosylase I